MPGTGERAAGPSDVPDSDGPTPGVHRPVTDGGPPDGGETDDAAPAEGDAGRGSADADADADVGRSAAGDSARYSWLEWGDPSVGVVEAVAAATDRDAAALPPLQDSIDGDGLDQLLYDRADAEIRIAFRYAGTEVTVDADGGIVVRVDAE